MLSLFVLKSQGRKHWRHVRQTTTRILILNLAVSDLLVSVLVMPFEFVEELTQQWMFGLELCKIVEFLQTTSFGVNIISVAFISLDRLLLLAKPITWRSRVQVAKYFVLISWLLPFLLSTPDLYLFNIVDISVEKSSVVHSVCSRVSFPYSWMDKLYWSLDLYYVNVLPFGVIVFCYIGIIRKVVKRRVGEISGIFNSTHSHWHRIRVNTTRLALIVITLFIACWIPTIVLLSFRIARGSEFVHRSSVIYEVALFMAYTNEALNPVLYGYFDSFFRRMLGRMIHCRGCCCVANNEVSGIYSTETDLRRSLSLHVH